MSFDDLLSGLYLNNLSSVRPAESSPQLPINNAPVQPVIGLKENPIPTQPIIDNDPPTIFSVDRFKAKLKEKDVLKIRKMHQEGKKLSEMAKIYNVTSTTILYICNRKNWKHI